MQKKTPRHIFLLAVCGLLTLGPLTLTGCSGRSTPPSPELESVAWWEEPGVEPWIESLDEEARFVLSREILLDTAEVALGTPYRSGGTSLNSGFDCSGFVQWAYKKSLGIDLPRTAREQSRFGEPVSRENLREGDIVAFRHPRRGYHTGIYVGDGKFIHSPRKRSTVQIVSLDNAYFKPIFIGARRLPVPDDDILAEAKTRLEAFKASRSSSGKTAKAAEKRSTPQKERKLSSR